MKKLVVPFQRIYAPLVMRNVRYFLLFLVLLAAMPLGASMAFDWLVQGNQVFEPFFLLTIVLFLLVIMLLLISTCLWASFRSDADGGKKLLLIMASYLMIWFAFGNLYYFFQNTESYLQVYEAANVGVVQHEQSLLSMPSLWQVDPLQQELALEPTNRGEGYVNCLYFSGVTLLTIGYGDIVPNSSLMKLLVLLEAFLGQFITVLAIGIWLSGMQRSRR